MTQPAGGPPGTVYGMDISIYQNPTPPLDGLTFVCVKASQGDGFEDPRWQQHSTAVRQKGLDLIAYHFGTNENVAGQVGWLLRVASNADAWCLDYESYHDLSMHPDQAKEFIARMQSAGKRCGLYYNCSNAIDAGQDWDWLADPGNYCPSHHRDMLQTRSGTPYGDQATTDSLAKILQGNKPVRTFTITEDQPHKLSIPDGTQLYDLNGNKTRTVSGGRTKPGYVKGQLAQDNANYWLVPVTDSGNEVLAMVRQKDVNDEGLWSTSGGGGGRGGTYQDGFDAAKAKALSAINGL